MEKSERKERLSAALMREMEVGQTFVFPIKDNYIRLAAYKTRYGKSLQRTYVSQVDDAKGLIYLSRTS